MIYIFQDNPHIAITRYKYIYYKYAHPTCICTIYKLKLNLVLVACSSPFYRLRLDLSSSANGCSVSIANGIIKSDPESEIDLGSNPPQKRLIPPARQIPPHAVRRPTECACWYEAITLGTCEMGPATAAVIVAASASRSVAMPPPKAPRPLGALCVGSSLQEGTMPKLRLGDYCR